jgi:hypothetical protein
VNALADEEVGKLVSKYFISSFQKVATFKIVGNQKQGGNVACYFCAPDGRVLHAIAGPVNAKTFREEVSWVIRKTKAAQEESKGDATKFKELMRKYHAERLREDYGIRVTPILKDQALQDLNTASAYRDGDGRRLAPVLTVAEIENRNEVKTQPTNAVRVHQLLAAHAGMKIEDLYGAVFQGILNEKISTKPVQADTPFPGRATLKAVEKDKKDK